MSQTDHLALHDGDGNNSKNKETVIGQQSCEFCSTFLFSKSLPSFTSFFLRLFVQYSHFFRFSFTLFFTCFFLSLRCLLLFFFLSFLFSLFIFVFITHN